MEKELAKDYVIFGAGRVGVNMAGYLKSLGHKVSLVSHDKVKSAPDDCARLVTSADIVAAALPDTKIGKWFDQWKNRLTDKPAIHFSGALTISGMFGYHPLFSFPVHKLSEQQLEKIVFACPQRGPDFAAIFPGAQNPNFVIPDHERGRYHALAVLSGNFISFLMNQTQQEFAAYFTQGGLNEMNADVFGTYIKSVMDRFAENPANSMTGPIARHDRLSVEANQNALEKDEILRTLYAAFLQAAWPDYGPNYGSDYGSDNNIKNDK